VNSFPALTRERKVQQKHISAANTLLTLKIEEGDCKPRNMDGLPELERKHKETDSSPTDFRKECGPATP
jgi:hypothetical protein